MKLHWAIEQFISLKKSLGFRFRIQGYFLRAFSRAMGKVNVGQVKPAAVRAYLDGHGPVTQTWVQKWRILRGFYGYAITRGLVHRSPLPRQAPKVDSTFTPYIYSEEDLRKLLDAITPERTRSLSPQTMRTLLLLLYGAGLRLSAHQCFLRTKTGCRLECSTVGKAFRAVRQAAGVKRTDGSRYQPRLHDLRHSRATHGLLAWYRQGIDLHSLLPQLSAYLGHAEFADTQRYLTLTTELRQQANTRFARYVWGGDRE